MILLYQMIVYLLQYIMRKIYFFINIINQLYNLTNLTFWGHFSEIATYMSQFQNALFSANIKHYQIRRISYDCIIPIESL